MRSSSRAPERRRTRERSAGKEPPLARETVIRARRGWIPLDLREIWEYRELLYVFVWRDLKVRYRQTFLGILWVVFQPLASLLIFTIIFHRIARLSPPGVAYPLWLLVGMLVWNLFSAGVSGAGNSLLSNLTTISKQYFPRVYAPATNIATQAVDFLVACVLLLFLYHRYSASVTPRALLAPLFVLLAATFALAVGLWLSALNVEFRDVRVIIPFIVQFWMYATPVVYPFSVIPEKYRLLVALNPMVGVMEGMRWSLLGTPMESAYVSLAVLVTLLTLVSGAFYFRRTERLIVDLM